MIMTVKDFNQPLMSNEIKNLTQQLMDVRRAKREVEDELKQAKEMEEDIEEQIIHLMGLLNINSFKNDDCQITKRVFTQPKLEDYEALIGFIQETGAFDVLQKRLSAPAVRDRWENGQAIPGVTSYTEESLTVRENI